MLFFKKILTNILFKNSLTESEVKTLIRVLLRKYDKIFILQDLPMMHLNNLDLNMEKKR